MGSTNSSGTYYATSAATAVIAKAGSVLGLTMANQIPVYRSVNNLSASTSSVAGKVAFSIGGKAIPGCKSLPSNAANSYVAICPWKPAVHRPVSITATFTSTDSNYLGSTTTIGPVLVAPRTGRR